MAGRRSEVNGDLEPSAVASTTATHGAESAFADARASDPPTDACDAADYEAAPGGGPSSSSSSSTEPSTSASSATASGDEAGRDDEDDDDDDGDDDDLAASTAAQLSRLSLARSRSYSFTEEEENNTIDPAAQAEADDPPVGWLSLPNKTQLLVLTLARFSEPLTQTSLQAYIFHQIKSFDPQLPDATISEQTGIIQGSFSASQFFTAVIWGWLADSEFMGRKRVLIVGLLGTCVSCVGFGLSHSFRAALFWRTVGGALNSNAGVMRAMISEIVTDKKYQSRAFLLLPMCFNIGIIVGPIIGGVLADPVKTYPGVFGPGSWLGGADGVWWMREWPYALPNLVSAWFILISVCAVFFGLDETHETAKYRHDWGRSMARSATRYWRRRRHDGKLYDRLGEDDGRPDDGEHDDNDGNALRHDVERSPSRAAATCPSKPLRSAKPPFREVWTPNVLATLLTKFITDIHISAYTALCFVFLPTPRAPAHSRSGLLHFGGGLGMSSSRVGFATAVIGLIGFPIQIFAYPVIQHRLGILASMRFFLPFSPLSYLLTPFLVLLPQRDWLVWPAMALAFSLQVLSRTFVLPASVILINNSVTSPSVLATVHGVAQSISSLSRMLGPMLGGWGLGLGLRWNMVGLVFWAMAVEAMAS
ncbi:hypothetical protein KEM52_001300, partial [Ascosphaera acerosa]